jgi:hypothetical protein
LRNTYLCFISHNRNGVLDYLRTRDAAEARSVIDECRHYISFSLHVDLFHLAVHHRLTSLLQWFLKNDEYRQISHDLCSRDAVFVRSILDMCGPLFETMIPVALHHGFTDMITAMVEEDIDNACRFLKERRAAEAGAVIQLCPSRCELISVAAHHGLHDIMTGYLHRDLRGVEEYLSKNPGSIGRIAQKCTVKHWRLVPFIVRHQHFHLLQHFIARDAEGRFIAPAYTPPSPHRMSSDKAVNAWLWLIKGDGDVSGGLWSLMKTLGLLSGEKSVVEMLIGLYASGGKIETASASLIDFCDRGVIIKHAISSGNFDMVKSLIDGSLIGADLGGNVLLHHVRDVPIAQYLVEKKASVSTTACFTDDTPLHHAHNVSIAKYFVENGLRADMVNGSRRTPLHMAKNVDVARYLLEMNADVHARDTDGHTPIHSVDGAATVQLLVDHNADVNAVSKSGNTRLHGEEDPAIIQCLIKNGVDVRMLDNQGNTALHYADDDAVLQSLVENAARYAACVAPPQSHNERA